METLSRVVVVLCGPPGAGKTTAAHRSGLEVFDRDDACWVGEKQFRDALSRLADDARARAVVIRSGATSSARAKSSALVNATHVYVMGTTTTPQELTKRVRNRNRADKARSLAGIGKWFQMFDRADEVRDFAGWAGIEEQKEAVTTWKL